MADTKKKVYTIEIQLSNAQQQLTDTLQKLGQLDDKLTGLDRDSDAAKQLIAEMAATAKQVQALTAEVEGLGDSLDHLQPGTIGAMEREVEELERAWKRTTKGTKESEAAMLALGRAKGELRELEDAIDALHPKERAAAFVDFTNGLVGGFAVASAAATSWGLLGTGSAEKVEAAMQQLMVVMSGFEAISKATNSETLANVKNMWALGKAYLFGAESASTASKITRAALISTGIGAIVVLVSLLVANWDSFKAKFGGSEKLFTKIHEVASGVFSGLLASLKNVGEVVMKLWDGDFSGAVAKAKHIGQDVAKGYAQGVQEVVDDANRELMVKQIEAQERALKVQQAGGYDTAKLQRQILADKLAVLKQGTEEEKKAYAEAQAELDAFDNAQRKKRREDALAATLARLNGVVALEQAKGQESYKNQMSEKQAELTGLLAAETRNEAAITSKRAEIAALRAQHDTQEADKRRARFVTAQQDLLALTEKEGKDTLDLRVTLAEQLLAYDTDALRRREQKHEEASEKEIEQAHASSQALLQVQAEYNEKVRAGVAENESQRQDLLQQGRDTDAKFIAGTADFLADVASKSLRKPGFNLGTTILEQFFGVKPEQVDEVKAKLNEAFTSIYNSMGSVVSSLFDMAARQTQAALEAAQQQLQQVEQQLSDAQSKADSTAQQLDSATGARKDYLLQRLARERQEVAALAAAKKKAADEEAKQTEEQNRQKKLSAQLSAGQALATNIATAAEAVSAGVKAVSAGSALPFPANLAAIVASLAAVGAAVASAKQFASVTKYADGTGALGSNGVLRGPSHAQGGIDIFGADGTYYGEAEGGEAIIPRDSSQRNPGVVNWLLNQGRTRGFTSADIWELAEDARAAVQLAPRPAGYFAAGTGGLRALGRVGGVGAGTGDDLQALSAQMAVQNGHLAQLVLNTEATAQAATSTAQHTAATAAHTESTAQSNAQLVNYGPPRAAIGHNEAMQIEEERQAAIGNLASTGLFSRNDLRKLGWRYAPPA